MLIDKDGKLFGKINIIDFAIILVLIGAVIFIFMKLNKSGEIVPAAAQKQYELKVYVAEVESFVTKGMKVGDTLYDDSKNMPLGVITDIAVDDSVDFNPDTTGKLVKSGKEGYNSIEITSELMATPFDNGIIISGNKYGIGHSLTIRAGQSICFMRISGLSEKGADK